MEDSVAKTIAEDMAALGSRWRHSAMYKSATAGQPLVGLDVKVLVAHEMLAAARLGEDLRQDSRPIDAAAAAQSLLFGLYRDRWEDPVFWSGEIGRRIAWIMPLPPEHVPAAIAAAILGVTRQRVWQLVGMERLRAIEHGAERLGICTLSLFKYVNPTGALKAS